MAPIWSVSIGKMTRLHLIAFQVEVDITLDEQGQCHLKPPGSNVHSVIIDNTKTAAYAWKPKGEMILITLTADMMKSLRRSLPWSSSVPAWSVIRQPHRATLCPWVVQKRSSHPRRGCPPSPSHPMVATFRHSPVPLGAL